MKGGHGGMGGNGRMGGGQYLILHQETYDLTFDLPFDLTCSLWVATVSETFVVALAPALICTRCSSLFFDDVTAAASRCSGRMLSQDT